MKIEISQAELSELILQVMAPTQNSQSSDANTTEEFEQHRKAIFMREFASLAQAISGKQKIAAIRAIRSMSGLGLKDAKDVVESVGDMFWYPPQE